MATSRSTRAFDVLIEGERFELKPADVIIKRRRSGSSMAALLVGADSPWWFWVLERPVADAVADAVLELYEVRGYRSGHQLVEALRKRYS